MEQIFLSRTQKATKPYSETQISHKEKNQESFIETFEGLLRAFFRLVC
jgi:hypothetical protein